MKRAPPSPSPPKKLYFPCVIGSIYLDLDLELLILKLVCHHPPELTQDDIQDETQVDIQGRLDWSETINLRYSTF